MPTTRPQQHAGDGQLPRQREAQFGRAELRLTRGPEAGARFVITAPGVVLGRHRDSDIRFDDPTVSRCHAEIRVDAGRHVLIDCGSLNGTYLNRHPIESAELADGDEIWIGKARFIFHTSA